MNREEQIKAIYEKIADKTLSFGCRIENHKSKSQILICVDNFGELNTFDMISGAMYCLEKYKNIIIGHPVMIGRCDLLIEKGPDYFDEWIEILDLWEKKDEPLEEQSDDCISYIYNLIK